jgi:starch-binding outer membrane protein, SusD/RagB family
MKNYIISSVLTLILLVGFSSCDEETIELLPIGNTEGTYFENESQMQEAVFGIYQKLGFFYAFRGGANNHASVIWYLPSDDLTTPANYGFENFSALSASNSQLNLYYSWAYQLIARANTVLAKIEEKGDVVYGEGSELRNNHRGEALFLRAYMYFHLWNVFGTAPLVTERIVNLDNAYPPNSEGTELLDQAIVDLEEAKNLLPENWPAAFTGRATKNSARGLKGKILVFRGMVNNDNADFTAAISEFNELQGLALTEQYSHNFDVNFENNQESLFEYQANSAPGNANPFVGGAGGNDAFSVIGEINHYIGYFNQLPTWIGNSVYTATPSIIDAYEDGDPRLAYNIDEAEVLLNVKKYVRDNAWIVGPFGTSTGLSANNPRILRYADILLLRAEAIVRSGGNLGEAVDLINQVRERARNSGESPSAVPADRSSGGADAATVLDWIFEERRLELAFEEGHRWWDLRRRHIAGEIDLTTWDFESIDLDFNFEERHVYFPLPEQEVVENPNLNQNPGY